MKYLALIICSGYLSISIAQADYTAFSVTPEYNGTKIEVCGSGIDEYSGWAAPCPTETHSAAVVGPGCDRLCTGTNDKDKDGYPVGQDCDDTNRLIFPGYEKACGSDGWQVCQANGQWSDCSETERCAASGSGDCYYIDYSVTGCGGAGCSDSNDGLTRATAWATPANINYNDPGALVPTSLGPGDVVYFLSTGNAGSTTTLAYTYVYSATDWSIYLRPGTPPTAANPLKIRPYPGFYHNIELDPACDVLTPCRSIYMFSAPYTEIEGFKITGGYNAGVEVQANGGSGVVLRNNMVYEGAGDEDGNNSGFYIHSCVDCEISNNFVWDNYDPSDDDKNNTNTVFFQGAGTRFHHNVVFYSDAANTGGYVDNARCLKYKHGEASFAGSAEWDHNIIMTCGIMVMETVQGNHNIHNNLVIEYGDYAVAQTGTTNYDPDGLQIKNNTFIAGRGYLTEFGNRDTSFSDIQVKHNLFIDDQVSDYSDDQPLMRVDHYGVDADYTSFIVGGAVNIDYNCYYNPNQEFEGTVFGSTGGGATPLGAVYTTFATWQGVFDGGGYQENPSLNALNEATSTNCKRMGWVSQKKDENGGGGIFSSWWDIF